MPVEEIDNKAQSTTELPKDEEKYLDTIEPGTEELDEPYSARIVWNVQRLTELAPSSKHPWRKIFRFTIEQVTGLFYVSGGLVPNNPVYRQVIRGCRGMLTNDGRLIFIGPRHVCPPPFKPFGLYEVCRNTAAEVLKCFYRDKPKVKLKNGKKQDVFEYLGINTPEVQENLQPLPDKPKRKFKIKPTIVYKTRFRPEKERKRRTNKLSYDMLPPDSWKAKILAKNLERKLNAESQETTK